MIKEYEGSTFDLVIGPFYNPDGGTETPTSLRWQVYDADTGAAMNTEQTVAVPAATNTITITTAINSMYDEDKTEEVRRVEIRAGYTSGNKNKMYEYGLINLFGS